MQSNKKTTYEISTQSYANYLLPFERVPLGEEKSSAKVSDEELNSRYVKGEVRIITEQARYSLAGILRMLEETVPTEKGGSEARYLLDPEYQRRHRWSVGRKSRLIESFLMNVPVPPVFLYERDLARFEVMDGRQRLTALKEFYNNEFALEGLEYWSDLNGRRYNELPKKIRDGIDRRYISSIILLKETAVNEEQARALKKIVFERLNSGGVKLSRQETRNAIYGGSFNNLCIELSSDKRFRAMWGIPDNVKFREEDDECIFEDYNTNTKSGVQLYEKMTDVELVLRFFAYRRIEEFKYGLNRISELLDRFIALGNNFNDKNLNEYRSMFKCAIGFLWELLGSAAFTTLKNRHRPTKIIYDPLMFISSLPNIIPHHRKLINNKDTVKNALKELYSNNNDLFNGRKTNYADTQSRNEKMYNMFLNLI